MLSPVEYAIARVNREILLILLESTQRTGAKILERNKNELLDAIEALPDLTFQVNVKSNLNFSPFLRKFPSSAIYKVIFFHHLDI